MLCVCVGGGSMCVCMYGCVCLYFREREGSGQCVLETWRQISDGEI